MGVETYSQRACTLASEVPIAKWNTDVCKRNIFNRRRKVSSLGNQRYCSEQGYLNLLLIFGQDEDEVNLDENEQKNKHKCTELL